MALISNISIISSLKFAFYTQATGLERSQNYTSRGRDQDPRGRDP